MIDNFEITDTCISSINLGNDTILCLGDTISLQVTNSNTALLWQDGTMGSMYEVTQPGVYWVEETLPCGQFRDSILVSASTTPSFNLFPDTTICPGDTLFADSNITGFPLLWSTGSSTPFITPTQSANYWIEVTTNCSKTRDTFTVTLASQLNLNLGNDTMLCQGNALTISSNLPASIPHLWNTGATGNVISVGSPGTYSLRVNGLCNLAEDSLVVQVIPKPQINLPQDTGLCLGDTLKIKPQFEHLTAFEWSDGSVDTCRQITGAMALTLRVKNACFEDSSKVSINTYPLPSVDGLSPASACENKPGMITLYGPENYEYTWDDGTSSATRSIYNGGEYSVTVSNQFNCSVQHEFNVNSCVDPIYIPNAFRPNGDNRNEVFRVHGTVQNLLDFKLRIFNRWGEQLFETSNPTSGWDGTYKSRLQPAGIYVYRLYMRSSVNTKAIQRIGRVHLIR